MCGYDRHHADAVIEKKSRGAGNENENYGGPRTDGRHCGSG
jgi:hypothetical protein